MFEIKSIRTYRNPDLGVAIESRYRGMYSCTGKSVNYQNEKAKQIMKKCKSIGAHTTRVIHVAGVDGAAGRHSGRDNRNLCSRIVSAHRHGAHRVSVRSARVHATCNRVAGGVGSRCARICWRRGAWRRAYCWRRCR